jgi:hypothetical protein
MKVSVAGNARLFNICVPVETTPPLATAYTSNVADVEESKLQNIIVVIAWSPLAKNILVVVVLAITELVIAMFVTLKNYAVDDAASATD